MWKCKVCTKEIEDDEECCYYCGAQKGITGEVVAEVRKQEIEKVKNEIETSPENIDKFYEPDYSTYTRDWFNIFNVHSLKFALVIYASPIIGISFLYIAFTRRMAMSEKAIGIIVGLILVVGGMYYINRRTKVYGLKRKQGIV